MDFKKSIKDIIIKAMIVTSPIAPVSYVYNHFTQDYQKVKAVNNIEKSEININNFNIEFQNKQLGMNGNIILANDDNDCTQITIKKGEEHDVLNLYSSHLSYSTHKNGENQFCGINSKLGKQVIQDMLSQLPPDVVIEYSKQMFEKTAAKQQLVEARKAYEPIVKLHADEVKSLKTDNDFKQIALYNKILSEKLNEKYDYLEAKAPEDKQVYLEAQYQEGSYALGMNAAASAGVCRNRAQHEVNVMRQAGKDCDYQQVKWTDGQYHAIVRYNTLKFKDKIFHNIYAENGGETFYICDKKGKLLNLDGTASKAFIEEDIHPTTFQNANLIDLKNAVADSNQVSMQNQYTKEEYQKLQLELTKYLIKQPNCDITFVDTVFDGAYSTHDIYRNGMLVVREKDYEIKTYDKNGCTGTYEKNDVIKDKNGNFVMNGETLATQKNYVVFQSNGVNIVKNDNLEILMGKKGIISLTEYNDKKIGYNQCDVDFHKNEIDQTRYSEDGSTYLGSEKYLFDSAKGKEVLDKLDKAVSLNVVTNFCLTDIKQKMSFAKFVNLQNGSTPSKQIALGPILE